MVVSMERWIGKVAVVTGASAGIGAGIAKALAEVGVTVAAFVRETGKVQELAATLTNAKAKIHAVKVDVTKEEDIIRGFQWVEDNLGPVHILINNAGVFPKNYSSLSEGDTAGWKQVLDTNVLGLCIATREALQSMKEHGINDGHVIHINSVAGHWVPFFDGVSIYPASKHAVTALTETLRQELISKGSKIRVTSISPGYVKTDIFVSSGMLETKTKLEEKPTLVPEDVADAVLYALGTPSHVQVHELLLQAVGTDNTPEN